jgi:hypothetical protein
LLIQETTPVELVTNTLSSPPEAIFSVVTAESAILAVVTFALRIFSVVTASAASLSLVTFKFDIIKYEIT